MRVGAAGAWRWRGAPLLLLLAACGQRPPRDAQSVLLITVDTLRADHLGCYGARSAVTPVMDALAAAGVLFEDARSCVPLTLPAHASILTGTYPPHHGIRDNGVAKLAGSALSVAEVFQAAGWTTAAFVSAVVLDRGYGLDQGFAVYDQVGGRTGGGGLVEERRGARTIDAAVKWLGQVEAPYFLWVHLYDPHIPYDPPGAFRSRFQDDLYTGEIAYVDREIGRLLAAVDARPQPLVKVLTSDHGEGLMEHGEENHGVFVYDSCLRVPLLVVAPGVPAGQRAAGAVATVDIAPTLLELVGLPRLQAAQGESLVSRLHGGPARERSIYFENYGGYLGNGWSPLIGLTNGRDKVIAAPRPELYELAGDPGERVNLWHDRPELAQRLERAARDAWRALASPVPLAEARTLSGAERSALEQLGYAVGSAADGPLPFASAELPDPKDRVESLTALNQGMGLLLAYQADPARGTDKLEQAIRVLQAGLTQDPEGAMLHEFLGSAYLMRGDVARAIGQLRHSIARRPERSSARHNLAIALQRSGDTAGAIEELQRLVQLDADFVQAWASLGELREAAGDLPAAATAWEQFLARWGADDENARTARSRLLRLRDRMAR